MSSVSRPVSGQTPMRGMIEEQSVQSASVKGSVSSSESVIDASIMSSVSIVKEGSESSGMSELVDRMLKYQPPPNLTAEMGKTVEDVIKYMKSTAELLRVMALSTPASITHPIQTCLSDLDCLATVVYHCGMYRDGGVSHVVPTSGPKVNEVVAVCDLSLREAGDAKPWPDLPPNLRLKCLTAPDGQGWKALSQSMLGDTKCWQVLCLCWCAHVFLHKDELSVLASKNGDMIPFSDYMYSVTSVYLCDQQDCNTDDLFWLYLRNIADPSTGAFLEIAEFSIVTQIWGIRLLLGFYWDGKVSPVWVYDSGQNDSTDIYIVADSDLYYGFCAQATVQRRVVSGAFTEVKGKKGKNGGPARVVSDGTKKGPASPRQDTKPVEPAVTPLPPSEALPVKGEVVAVSYGDDDSVQDNDELEESFSALDAPRQSEADAQGGEERLGLSPEQISAVNFLRALKVKISFHFVNGNPIIVPLPESPGASLPQGIEGLLSQIQSSVRRANDITESANALRLLMS